MTHKADATKLRDQLRREHFEVEPTGSGHWEVRTKEGERVTIFSQTPGDRRWILNATGAIRRWKRSKELRS